MARIQVGLVLRDICIVGLGKVGSSLRQALYEAGFSIVEKQDISENTLVFVTVPDRFIVSTINDIVSDAQPLAFVYSAGSLKISEVQFAIPRFTRLGWFHPLQSFASEQAFADKFKNIYIGVDANEKELAELLSEIAVRLGAKPLSISEEQRVLYHAAASIASNYFVAIEQLAVKVMESAVGHSGQGIIYLLPLIEGTLENIKVLGVRDALTGPIVRGDVKTVQAHLGELKQMVAQGKLDRSVLTVYCDLALYLIKELEYDRLNIEQIQALEDILSRP